MKKILIGFSFLIPSVLQAGNSGITSIPRWNGLYVGGNLGAITSQFNGSVADDSFIDASGRFFPSFAHPYNTSQISFTGGAQLGYLTQTNQLIYGTEISIYGFNLKRTHIIQSDEVTDFLDIFKPGDSFHSKMNWQASWVGRLGTEIPNWLAYGLAGVSIANPQISTNIIPFIDELGNHFPPSQGSDSKILVGFTLGLGSEYKVSSNGSFGLEYRFSYFGNKDFDVGQNAVSAAPNYFIYTAINAHEKLITNLIVAKINYYFNSL